MTPHDLLANFETLAEAPDGIQRLRELVVELAVRGKLLDQNSSDEPASELLKQIKKEKTQPSVVRTRKSKDPLAQENTDTTPPFEVPEGWVWCRLLDVCHRVHYGFTAPSTNDATHVRLVRITDIQNGKVAWEHVPGCDVSAEDASSFILNPRDILIARTGGTIGKTFLVDEVPRPSVFASYLIRAIPCGSVDARFLKRFCEAPTYWNQLRAGSMGTGQPNVNASTLSQMWVPLPPGVEQRRIVARVDELMALLDRLEAKRQEREIARAASRNSALAALRDSETHDDLERAWLRVQERFGELFASPEDFESLRALVLTLAMRGKLVEQNLMDESARLLVEQIGKGMHVKRSSNLNGQSPKHVPYDLPRNWVWARFDQIASIDSNLVDPARYPTASHVAPDNIEKFTGKLLPYRTVAEDGVQSSNHHFHSGQILYSKIRPNLSKVVVVDFPGLCSADMYPLSTGLDRAYFHRFLLSEPFLVQVTSDDNRVAMPKVNQLQLSAVLVPVPPLAEQRRIAARVEELTLQLDRLAGSVATRLGAAGAFAAAAVYHLEV